MSSGRFVGGLLLGSLLGAVLALLTAPKSGQETRSWLVNELGTKTEGFGQEMKKHASELRGCVNDMTDKAFDKANFSMDELRERVQKVAANIEDSARTFIDKARNSNHADVAHAVPTEEFPN
jgi:gas vesicle protein